tara:strand:+ start:1994 stop:2710 length:717 start_codon:yes stop_codon:yes gene_type:complete
MDITNTAAEQRGWARLTGLAYLVIIAGALFSQIAARGGLIVAGDPQGTLDAIRASEDLWRLGFVAEIMAFCADVLVAFGFYVILRPVSRNLALLAAFFRLVMAAVQALNMQNHFDVLFLIDDAAWLTAFDPAQLAAMAMLSLKAHTAGYMIGLVFFGFGNAVLGFALLRSRYVPALISFLVMVGALAVAGGLIAIFLDPAISQIISPWYMLPTFFGEVSLALWLVIMGVKLPSASKAG